MKEKQRERLVEWLKSQGLTDEQIMECLEYISK